MTSALTYAANYLTVFEIGDADEKRRHGRRLFDDANAAAQSAGFSDFLSLIESNSPTAWSLALQYAKEKWVEFDQANKSDRYWLATFAIIQFMILNAVNALDDCPEGRTVANCAAHLYSWEYTYQQISDKAG